MRMLYIKYDILFLVFYSELCRLLWINIYTKIYHPIWFQCPFYFIQNKVTIHDMVDDILAYYEIKMAVGGAPISQMFADEIGADGYGADASSAVDLFLKLVEKK